MFLDLGLSLVQNQVIHLMRVDRAAAMMAALVAATEAGQAAVMTEVWAAVTRPGQVPMLAGTAVDSLWNKKRLKQLR